MGGAAADHISDRVYNTLVGNPMMLTDHTPLFHKNHRNEAEIRSRINIDALTAARVAMKGKEDQEQAFREGKTRACWPHSAHNQQRDGLPCSLALDVFQLKDGQARFRHQYFHQIHRYNEALGVPIVWGGTFRAIRDSVHFQLIDEGV